MYRICIAASRSHCVSGAMCCSTRRKAVGTTAPGEIEAARAAEEAAWLTKQQQITHTAMETEK
jgi:hypothetical protein